MGNAIEMAMQLNFRELLMHHPSAIGGFAIWKLIEGFRYTAK